MENFTCNPFAFLLSSFSIKKGPTDRKVRADMALSATPPLCNDDFAIAESNRPIPIHLRHVARQEVARLLNHDSEGSSDSSDDSGQLISLPTSVSLSITLTGSTGSHVAAAFFVDNPTLPDLYHLARSVIMNLQNPNILRGSFGIQTPPMPLHLIVWNPQYEEDCNHLSHVALARKVARKLWFEDTPSSSNIKLSSHIADQFEYVPSSVVITELLDDDSESQAKDNSVGFGLTLSAMSEDSDASPSHKRSKRSKSITPLCTTEVCRSPRSNKYMGFKVDLPSYSHGRKLMIKPRASIVISDPAPSIIVEAVSSSSAPPPPPMTIKYIQQVGTRLCGIPSEELTDECLLAKGKDDDQYVRAHYVDTNKS
ncbi:hypothetical protein ZWY2020_021498 [Hordeum vulgare]|nr:hypothetical protein ZWY2020_021498 [Hordeum vulgare]